MTDRIERLLLAKQEDIDTLGSELEIAERERDRYRAALDEIGYSPLPLDAETALRIARKALSP